MYRHAGEEHNVQISFRGGTGEGGGEKMRTVASVASKLSPSILGDTGLAASPVGMAVLVVALALAMERTRDHNARFLGPMPTNLVSMGTGLGAG